MSENDMIAPPDKYFYTADGKTLTNLYQLAEYLKKCPQSSFEHHVTDSRNDFCNWVTDVFGISELASKLRNDNDKMVCAQALEDFMAASNEKAAKEKKDEADKKAEEEKDASEKITEKKDVKPEEKKEEKKEEPQAQPAQTSPPAQPPQGDGKFKEYSDEELEKFTKFGIHDTETPADEKLDYMKTELNEIKNMIKEQRRMGKDLIVADLMLRVVEPKMAYYEYTKKQEDYEKIIRVFNDVKREIDYAQSQTEDNMADQIIKQLELQKVMLKKDFTQKKQGVLGKIFKRDAQEVEQ